MGKDINWNQQQARANAFQNQFDNWKVLLGDRDFYKTYSAEQLEVRKTKDPIFAQALQIKDELNQWAEGFVNDLPE